MDVTSTLASIISSAALSISDFQSQLLWALIVGIILAFVLGFGMGANDVSNAFGTSVGSGVLTLRNAYILATIFETLGAFLIGYNVTDTMRRGVVDNNLYTNDPKELLIGQLSILGGCSAWLLIATFARLPVSTTHSVTGATIGFGLVSRGINGIQWAQVYEIVGSWFTSPILSGIVSSALFVLVDHTVLRRKNSFECGLRALPFFYWFCICFVTFVVTYQGSTLLHFGSMPLWLCILISLALATVFTLIIQFVMVPRLKLWIESKVVDTNELPIFVEANGYPENAIPPKAADKVLWKTKESGIDNSYCNTDEQAYIKKSSTTRRFSLFKTLTRFFVWLMPDRNAKENIRTLKIFSSIQVFTACFAGFAHGANDVSNAIAPLTSLIIIYKTMNVGQEEETPLYVLGFGVLAICTGLVCLGHKVIRTVGTRMSHINPASGFTIEFGAAVTALIASKIGVPISTTHSLVGSVVAVGSVRSRKGVDWSIFRNIFLSWVVTLPASGLIAAGIQMILKLFKLT